MAPYLITLSSCWKGTSDQPVWTEMLDPSVFASGPNGSGKSRLAEAAELLLTGGVSNYCGRPGPVKEAVLLWRSKPKGESILFVGGVLSNGDRLRWTQERATGRPTWTLNGEKIKKGQEPGVVQTIAEIRANLFGNPATAEKWLAGKLGLTTPTVLARVRATEARARKKLSEGDPEPASLLTTDEWALIDAATGPDTAPKALLDTLGKRQRSAADEAKGAARVVTDMEFAVGLPVTDAELDAADAAVVNAFALLDGARKLSANMQGLIAAYADYQRESAALATLPPVDTAAMAGLDVAQSILGTLDLVVAAYPTNPLCACCKTNVGTEALAARRAGLQSYIATAEATAEAAATRNRCEAAVTVARTSIQTALVIIPKGAVQALQQGTFTDPVPPAQAAYTVAQDALDDLQRRRIAAQAPGMAETAALSATTLAASYKKAIKVTTKALAAEIRAGLKVLMADVSSCFPAHFGTPMIALRPRVEIGVVKEGVTGAPSGGEETALLWALAGALAKAEDAEYERDADAADLAGADLGRAERLHMIVAEDRNMDAAVVTAMLDAFAGWTAGQVWFPTTTRVEQVPEGWMTFDFWPGTEGDPEGGGVPEATEDAAEVLVTVPVEAVPVEAVPSNGAAAPLVPAPEDPPLPSLDDLWISDEDGEVDDAMAEVFGILSDDAEPVPPVDRSGPRPPDVPLDFAAMTPIEGMRCGECGSPVYQTIYGDFCPVEAGGCGAGGTAEYGTSTEDEAIVPAVPVPVSPDVSSLSPLLGVYCLVCGDALYKDGSGVICVKGHRPEIHAAAPPPPTAEA